MHNYYLCFTPRSFRKYVIGRHDEQVNQAEPLGAHLQKNTRHVSKENNVLSFGQTCAPPLHYHSPDQVLPFDHCRLQLQSRAPHTTLFNFPSFQVLLTHSSMPGSNSSALRKHRGKKKIIRVLNILNLKDDSNKENGLPYAKAVGPLKGQLPQAGVIRLENSTPDEINMNTMVICRAIEGTIILQLTKDFQKSTDGIMLSLSRPQCLTVVNVQPHLRKRQNKE